MATNTAASFTNHTGNGTAGPFNVSFSYLSEAEVDVTVGGVLKTLSTHYTFTSATQITFTSGNEPGNGVAIKFQRDTNVTSKLVDFNDGSVLTETDLDNNANQLLFSMQEIVDSGAGSNVQSVSGSAPISSSGGVTPSISISAATSSAAGSMSASDKSKLDGIEASATADQTASEIRTLVNNASDSNVFTDADHNKLDGIETSATADQTGAEIKSLYEGQSDTNAFTDTEKNKLSGIESNATADQTNAEIKTAYEANSDTNVFTDAEKTKLSGVESNATADQTNAEIKTAYENNSDTNAFTDAEKTKLTGIETSADVTDQANVDAAGAVMNSDLDGKGELLVGDGSGDPSALSVGTNGYVLKANSSTATGLEWAAESGGGSGEANQNAFSTIAVSGQSDVVADSTTDTLNLAAGSNVTITTNAANDTITIASSGGGGGSGISNVVEDTTPQLGGNLDVQSSEITTSTSNGNIILNPNGTGVVEVKGDGTSSGTVGTLQLNCSNNNHGVKIASPPHSASASYTLTLPNTDGNANQVLKTDGSGGLDWVDQTAAYTNSSVDTHLNFSSASSGQVLSYNGSDYAWVAQSGGGATDKISEGNTEAETVDTGSDGHFKVTTEGTERLRVIADGKVGIGTSTPGELLQVYDASGNPTIHIRANNQNTASFKLENDDGNWTISSGTSSYPLKFAVGGSDKFTILNDGKVGIGTTSPSTVLEVNGSFKAGGLAYPTSDGSANQVLKTDGSGTLSFVDQASGGGGLSSDAKDNVLGGDNAGGNLDISNATSYVAAYNVFIGDNAGAACTTANSNTFIGNQAGESVTTGYSNCLFGQNTGQALTTGYSNVAYGQGALYSATTGDLNIAIGQQAMLFGNGNYNIAIGETALNGVSGDENIGIGTSTAKYATLSGNYNVLVGSFAGYWLSSGSNNICLGYQSGQSSSPSGEISSGSNNVVLGNNNISNLYCADTSISSSDSRDKTDVTDFTKGLEWIEALRPVTYRWDRRTWYGTDEEPYGTPDGSKKRSRLHLGFLAQEALAVEQANGYGTNNDNSLILNLTDDGMSYGMKYERLVPILVNAIKELSTRVKALEAG